MSWARRPITTAPVVRISSCNISVLRNASKSGYRRLTSPWRSFINPSSDMVAPTITFPIKISFRKELLQPYCALLSVYLNATEKTSSLLLLSSGCSLLLLTQLLLIQNHFQTLVNIPAHFAKAVFLVEPLGRNLEDGGVEMQGLIAKSAGTGFELIQNELAVVAPLIIRMDSHTFELGARWTCALQSTHRYKQAITFSNQKFSPILEIHFLDSIDIIIPGTTPQVGSGLLNGMHMQIFDSFSIGRLITAQGEHETCPHNFSRIARLSSGAIYFNSKVLFKPVVGIGLVVEGFYLLVSRVSVQLDGFNERAVRFQVKDRHSRFPGLVLQSL